jgi:DnaA family protein
MRQVPLALRPEPQETFEGFVAGADAAALAHLRAATPPRAPVYLWGPPGSGKSHLLRALARACAESGHAVAWFDDAPALPAAIDPGTALLLVDDVHTLDAAAQQRLFAALVEAQGQGCAWAAAGSAPPVDLPLREDLRTRIGWGHVFALQGLDEAGTRAVLLREAARRGIALGEEVLSWLLHRFERDLGSLMRLLDRLDDYALARARPVTVPLLRQMLAEEAIEDPA